MRITIAIGVPQGSTHQDTVITVKKTFKISLKSCNIRQLYNDMLRCLRGHYIYAILQTDSRKTFYYFSVKYIIKHISEL